MRTRGLVFASEEMLPIREDQSLQQVANVATLPGIVGPSLAMPDIHWGYGFAIGGVAAFDWRKGWFPPAAWATTSTAGCACSAPSCNGPRWSAASRTWSTPCSPTSPRGWAPGARI